jgi:hypothetical protein
MAGVLRAREENLERSDWLAGAGGFEPPNGGIKIRCLTTWLRPTMAGSRDRAAVRAGGT